MRHLKGGFKLRRNPAQRKSLLRNLTASLIEKNRIETTMAKAKAVRPIVEKMVTLGKSGTLADKRKALAYLYKRKTVQVLFDEIAPRFMDRNGGYTRIIKTDFRKGDGAEMAILEFVDYIFEVKDKKAKEKAKAKRAKK
ncbi:MAG: 50S ribosomal protein L17 [Candidatus Aminicenantes bacterium]|nr:50S ribosomal protein L17 [Candidatus Aminicenantes bacterium]NIM81554.1 50S ribosomal protein L17 [Candidatus Aminicenantes bacterium]NIN20925.1 50S ribosomal protein L17 [Candidatus Aminicenantes bacterium]NIN44746.1 50S ribosomal protein L17 [Candidatus Aminicenantes bacterium]NIN87554.1 50S ribosomal protein L17 [Candidatus Aminicenantes bacterium]